MRSADAIVVGAGAAGCVVARRLADAGRSVILVEAGPGLPCPEALQTIDTLDALTQPDRFWPGLTVASAPPRVEHPYRIGHGLGGGTAVNAMVMTTGDRADYDRWDQHWGATGWGWPGFGPWFDDLATRFSTEPAPIGPLAGAVRSSIEAEGGSVDGLSADVDGWGFTAASITTRHGLRHGAAEAFVGSGPALGSPSGDGIDLMAESPVRRVLFSAGAAVGVELIDGSQLGGGTVVLSAGALNSPALLRASGVESVGDERPVVDHPSFVFPIALRPEFRCPLDQAVVPISGVVRWSARIGVTGRPRRMADLMAFVMDHVGSGPDGRRFGAIVLVLADVASVGSLRWTGDKMRLDPGWLNHDLDRQTLIMGARQIAALLRSGPVASAAEGVFVDDVGTNLDVFERLTDVELGDWLVTHPGPIAHPGASCSPVLNGTPGPGLVDLDGAVRGHRRLHVIDGSTLPYLPAANPQLPIMALAARLSSDL